jgi:hypothetical protein
MYQIPVAGFQESDIFKLLHTRTVDRLFILSSLQLFTDLTKQRCGVSCISLKVPYYTRVYPKFPDSPPGARAANGTALCH